MPFSWEDEWGEEETPSEDEEVGSQPIDRSSNDSDTRVGIPISSGVSESLVMITSSLYSLNFKNSFSVQLPTSRLTLVLIKLL